VLEQVSELALEALSFQARVAGLEVVLATVLGQVLGLVLGQGLQGVLD
jgi:hypothetical protein